MSDTTTINEPAVRVGDLIVPTAISPQRLQNFYEGKVGVCITSSEGSIPKVRFEERTDGDNEWYVSEWRYADAQVGDKVRIIAALDGATQEFKGLAAGRTATVLTVADFPTVRLDDPFYLDGRTWEEFGVEKVVVTKRAGAVAPEATTEPVDLTPETEESLRQRIREFEHRHDRLQDVLAEQAQERDWCSEFEEFCENNNLESRRETESDWLITVDLSYDKSVDEMVDYIEGGSCASDSDRVRFTYRTTVSWTGRDVDDADISDLLSDAGFSEWSDYDVVDTERN